MKKIRKQVTRPVVRKRNGQPANPRLIVPQKKKQQGDA